MVDPEYLAEVAERVERIRDHVPSEEFDVKTAAALAHRELAPFAGDTSAPVTTGPINNHHAGIQT